MITGSWFNEITFFEGIFVNTCTELSKINRKGIRDKFVISNHLIFQHHVSHQTFSSNEVASAKKIIEHFYMLY